MADQLFPTFDFPGVEEEATDDEKYRPSAYYDFRAGDFRRDGANRMVEADGREAYLQWCVKCAMTEREECLAYSEDYGTELEDLSDVPDRKSRESEIQKTITDALMVNPNTEEVRDFEFSWEGDEFNVSFVVKGYDWNEEKLEITG